MRYWREKTETCSESACGFQRAVGLVEFSAKRGVLHQLR